MKKIVFLCCLWANCFASDSLNKASIAFIIGQELITNSNLSTASPHLDYLQDIVLTDIGYYLYIGFDIRVPLKKRQSIQIKSTTYSDLEFKNLDVSYTKMKTKNIGFLIGANKYIWYLNDNPTINPLPELANARQYYNNRQFYNITSRSIYGGGIYQLQRKYFTIDAKINVGIGGIKGFEEDYVTSRINTFETIAINYKTTPSIYAYIQPQAKFSFFPFVARRSKLGFQAAVVYQPMFRRINYDTEIAYWTLENLKQTSVKAPRHFMQKTNLDVGIIYQF